MPGVAARIGLLALYLVGMVSLSRAMRGRLPVADRRNEGDSALMGLVPPPWAAIAWIWGPTLWFVPGLLWLGVLELPLGQILLVSFLLPLCCYLLFLWRNGILPIYALALMLSVTLLFVMVALTTHGLSYTKFALFSVSLVLPPLFSIWLWTVWAPEIVPLGQVTATGSKGTLPRWRSALLLVVSYFTGLPKNSWVVEDGHLHTRIPGDPWVGYGPGLLITEPENVVVLKSGSKIGRVVGPGVVLLERGEVPYRVVDLRNQIRSTQVNTLTCDGIEVTMPVQCAFRVNRGRAEVGLQRPWPYRSQRDVLQILFAEEVDPSGRSPLDAHTAHPWENLPTQAAAHKLEQAISLYSLDQLYSGIVDPVRGLAEGDPQSALLRTHQRLETALSRQASNRGSQELMDRGNKSRRGQALAELADPLTRLTVGKLVVRAVREALRPHGFDLFDGRVVGPIMSSTRGVIEQRVEAWKSRFIVKVMDWHASVERKRFEARERIRQEAREKLLAEMVEEATRRLQTTGTESQRDLIALYVLSSLIKMASSYEVQQMLPESALPALAQLQEQVQGEAKREGEL
jgi:hypothetical protein